MMCMEDQARLYPFVSCREKQRASTYAMWFITNESVLLTVLERTASYIVHEK